MLRRRLDLIQTVSLDTDVPEKPDSDSIDDICNWINDPRVNLSSESARETLVKVFREAEENKEKAISAMCDILEKDKSASKQNVEKLQKRIIELSEDLVRVKWTLLLNSQQRDNQDLWNKDAFRDRLATFLEVERRGWCALVFTDLSGIRQINNELGHEFGNRVIEEVKLILRSEGRQFVSYIKDPPITIHYGGDEFVLFFPGLRSYQDMISVQSVTSYIKDRIEHVDWATLTGILALLGKKIFADFGILYVKLGPRNSRTGEDDKKDLDQFINHPSQQFKLKAGAVRLAHGLIDKADQVMYRSKNRRKELLGTGIEVKWVLADRGAVTEITPPKQKIMEFKLI